MFVLSKIFGLLAAPSTMLLLLLVAGAALHLMRRRIGARLMIASAGLWLTIAALPLSAWLALPLENRHPDPAPPARVDGIILLGGIVRSELTKAHGVVSLSDRADRLTGFLALARRYPDARLIFTGGTGAIGPAGDVAPEADDLRRLVGDLGLDPARVVWEDRSRNTIENALFSKALMAPRPGETWLLVTSAWHMPRSVAVFEAAGWPVTPWPVDRRANPRLGFDPSGRLELLDLVVKEYQGLIAYRLMGRTKAVWP